MFPNGRIGTNTPMPLHGVHEVGLRRLEPLLAATVGGLPDHDDRFAYCLVVDAPSHGLLAFIVGSATQQPDAVLTVVAVYLRKFVQYPPMSFFCAYWNRYRIVATSSCFTILKMRPPTWLPPAVVANPLIEATTFVE